MTSALFAYSASATCINKLSRQPPFKISGSSYFLNIFELAITIYPALYAAVERRILEYGVTEFIVGHYYGFDGLTASAVKEAKRFYPEARLTLLLPYHPAERPIPTRQMDLTEHSIRLEWRATRVKLQS